MRLRSINIYSEYLGNPEKTREVTRLLRNDSIFLFYEFYTSVKFIDNDFLIQLNIGCDPCAEHIHIKYETQRGYPQIIVPFDHSLYFKMTDREKQVFWIHMVKKVFLFLKDRMNCDFSKIDNYVSHLEALYHEHP